MDVAANADVLDAGDDDAVDVEVIKDDASGACGAYDVCISFFEIPPFFPGPFQLRKWPRLKK